MSAFRAVINSLTLIRQSHIVSERMLLVFADLLVALEENLDV